MPTEILLNDENNSPLHTEKEVENDVKCDSAFTDDSCIPEGVFLFCNSQKCALRTHMVERGCL